MWFSFSEVFLAFTTACHSSPMSSDWNALLIMYLAPQEHLACSCLSQELCTQGVVHKAYIKACFPHVPLSSATNQCGTDRL